jgi:hypothetical protein
MAELREAGDSTVPVSLTHDGIGDASASPIFTIDTGWEPWYAWRPVKLYMSSRYAWLRVIYRRCLHKNGIEACDYTDTPDNFPTMTNGQPSA